MNVKKINGVGALFRFITPSMIIVLGTLILTNLNSISDKIVELKIHFTNHVFHHKDADKAYNKFRISMEGRLTSIETTIKIKYE